MAANKETVLKWFENYFKSVREYQGELETVPKLKDFFSSDLKLTMYSSPASPPANTMTRDELLMSFVHPGLLEDIIPHYYVVDIDQLIVVVQFEIQFKDLPSGKTWPKIQASAHYHLKADGNDEIKIQQIHYWTERLPEDLFPYWAKYREAALSEHAMSFLKSAN